MADLRQGNNESTSQFLKRAEDSADQIADSEVDVGMAITQGMTDNNEKKRISFECHKDLDFALKKVKKLTRAVFSEVGKTSLFDSKHQTPSSSASLPDNSEEALRQMVISACKSPPSILQGTRSIGNASQNFQPHSHLTSAGSRKRSAKAKQDKP